MDMIKGQPSILKEPEQEGNVHSARKMALVVVVGGGTEA